MLQQIALLSMMLLLGWVLIRSYFPQPAANRSALAFLSLFFGCSVYSLVLFALLALQDRAGGSIHRTFSLACFFSLLLAAVILLKKRRVWEKMTAGDFVVPVLCLLVIIAAGVLFSHFNYAATTYDSYTYLELGEGLALRGFAGAGSLFSWNIMGKRPVFYSMLHALSRPLHIDYLSIFLPVYSAVFMLAFLGILKDMLALICKNMRAAWAIASIAALLILSFPFMIYHFYYINNHMFSSIHFTLFFLAGWLALYKQSGNMAVAAVILLLPAALMRLENMLLILAFAAVLASFLSSLRPVRVIFCLTGAGILILSALYYGVLPDGDGSFISRPRMLVTGAAGFCFVLAGSALGRLHAVTCFWNQNKRHLPYALLLAAALLAAKSFLFHFETAGLSVPVMLYNMLDGRTWQHFWFFVLFMTLLLGAVPNTGEYKYQLFMTSGIFIFILLTIQMAQWRGSAYYTNPYDSANRMLIQIVPLVAAHLALAAAHYAQPLLFVKGGIHPNDPALMQNEFISESKT